MHLRRVLNPLPLLLEFTAAKARRSGLPAELHRALTGDLPLDAVTSELVAWTLPEPERERIFLLQVVFGICRWRRYR